MKFSQRILGAMAIGAAMMFGGGLTAPLAQAAYSVTLQQDADSGSGDLVGVLGSSPGLLLPEDYASGNLLSSVATWDNQTFSSLGVAPGSYRWVWGTGAHSDFFQLTVIEGATAVQKPSSILLLALPFGFVMQVTVLGRSSRIMET